MPTIYDFVLDWTGTKPDSTEYKRALARRRLREKEQRWFRESYERTLSASGYDRDQRGEPGDIGNPLVSRSWSGAS